MATSLKILSDFSDSGSIPNAKAMRFGIVVSEWNAGITNALYRAAFSTLVKYGAVEKNIQTLLVPGSFELTLGAHRLLLKTNIDAVICLGCVIQGETKHFDFICQAVAAGITNLNIKHNKPAVFGVLTTNTLKQAEDRSGGKFGNKGEEAALTAIKMLAL